MGVEENNQHFTKEDLELTEGKMKICDLGKNWFESLFPDGGTKSQIEAAINKHFDDSDVVGRAQRMEWNKKLNAAAEKKKEQQ